MASPLEGGGERLHAMDSLRAATMLLVVVFHASFPYTTIPLNRFRDPSTSSAFDVLVLFLHSFQMPLFFLAGGFFAALSIERNGLRGFARSRFWRLVLPLIVGWLLLAPLTRGAYEFAIAASKGGDLQSGIQALGEKNWVRWDKFYHLWFLQALLAFSIAGSLVRAAVLQIPPDRRALLTAWLRRVLAGSWRPAIVAALLAIPRIPAEFIPDYRDRAAFFLPFIALYFAIGWLLFTTGSLSDQRDGWRMTLGIGLALLPITGVVGLASHRVLQDGNAVLLPVLTGAVASLMSACLVFGVLGLFLARFGEPSAPIRYLSEASYWIYLGHMPLIVAFGGLFSTIPAPAIVKFTASVAATAAVLLFVYETAIRQTVVGALLNGRRPDHARGDRAPA